MISRDRLFSAAYELNVRAATAIPSDVKKTITRMAENETQPLPRYVLKNMVDNFCGFGSRTETGSRKSYS